MQRPASSSPSRRSSKSGAHGAAGGTDTRARTVGRVLFASGAAPPGWPGSLSPPSAAGPVPTAHRIRFHHRWNGKSGSPRVAPQGKTQVQPPRAGTENPGVPVAPEAKTARSNPHALEQQIRVDPEAKTARSSPHHAREPGGRTPGRSLRPWGPSAAAAGARPRRGPAHQRRMAGRSPRDLPSLRPGPGSPAVPDTGRNPRPPAVPGARLLGPDSEFCT